MKISPRALAIAASILLCSCAKNFSADYAAAEQEALDAWVESLGDQSIERMPSGIWVKMLSPVNGEAPLLEENDWADITYMGYLLPALPDPAAKGSVFVTRDSLTAAYQGSTGLYRTHYGTQKVWVSPKGSEITQAMFEALMMIKEGETIRVYTTSRLMFGSSPSNYSYGYQGQMVLPANKPCYLDITLNKVIHDVQQDEDDQVDAFAQQCLNFTSADLLKDNFYLRRYPENIDADSISKDSTVKIWYVGRMLDGFVFGTNIDSIALRVWADTTTNTVLTYTPKEGGMIQAFYDAVITMTYDSWGKMVFTSPYGYGYNGLYPQGASVTPADYGTQIDPFTPLFFEFYIPSNKTAEPTD